MADVRNLIIGPAQLFIGNFGTVEPGATSADFSGASWTPTSGWTDLGFTNGGVTFNLQKEYTNYEVDQLTMAPGAVVTSETVEVTTTMAEITLENLVLAMNDGTVTTSGGVKKFEPLDAIAGRPSLYKSVLLVGRAPAADAGSGSQRRFVVVRRVLSTAGVSLAYGKADQTTLEVTFSGFYVSSSVKPYAILDPASA